MRLFFKHLIHSIKAKPLQPFILLLTMILSMVVNVSVFSLSTFLEQEALGNQRAQYGTADITVTLNGTSKSRFMFTHRAEEILGERAIVVGNYDLPLYLKGGGQTAFGVATDVHRIGDVFEFSFSEYGTVTEAALNETAFVSRAFAEEYRLSIGDSFTAQVLGYEKTYTVQGISENRFLSTYDVVVNITGVMRLLAADSLFVSALGDDFKPCSTIYIDVREGVSSQECIDLLKTDGTFADKSFHIVSDTSILFQELEIPQVVIHIVIILTAILSAFVVFCCFYILSGQRAEENETFKAAGARYGQLLFLQYAEIFLYCFIGGSIGIVCAIPMLRFIISYTGFVFASSVLEPITLLKSGLVLLVMASLTTTAFALVENRKQKPKREQRGVKTLFLGLLALFTILFIGIFFVPMDIRLGWALTCGAMLLFGLFMGVPYAFRWTMQKLDAYRERKLQRLCHVQAVPLHYSIKNVYSVNVLHNTCRLFTLLCVIFFCIVLTVSGVEGYVDTYKHFLNGDYAVINATESCEQKVMDCESVENVYSIYFGRADYQDDTVQMLSVSDSQALSKRLRPNEMPSGNEAVLTEVYAKKHSLEVGESFALRMEEREYEFTVCALTKSDLTLIIFDNTHFNIPYNMLSVVGNETVPDVALKQELTNALALELTVVTPLEDILTTRLQFIEIILNSGRFLVPFVYCFCGVGMLDNLFESYRARKKEFELYQLCGMTKKEIAFMKTLELLIVFLFGIMITSLAFCIGAVILNQGLQALGFGLFIHL